MTLSLEGDETVANLVYADIVGRLDELKQIVDEDIAPEATEPSMSADWERYQSGDLDG